MNNRGFALIFCLVVISVLAVLSSSIFSRSINENKMAERYVYTEEALWAAEAGLAQCMKDLPGDFTTGTVELSPDHSFNATSDDVLEDGIYYRVDSIGTVTSAGEDAPLTRHIQSVVKMVYPETGEFNYAIETTGTITLQGSYTVTGPNGIPNTKQDDSNLDNAVNEEVELDFADLFGVDKDTVKENADHLYTEDTFDEPIDGITWVEVSEGASLMIVSNLTGSGLLVVNGDTRIAGTINFTGIIYIIGELRSSGTMNVYGSIFAECDTDINNIATGDTEITWDEDAINSALDLLDSLADKVIVAWYEI